MERASLSDVSPKITHLQAAIQPEREWDQIKWLLCIYELTSDFCNGKYNHQPFSVSVKSRHANEVLALKINLRVRGLPQDP